MEARTGTTGLDVCFEGAEGVRAHTGPSRGMQERFRAIRKRRHISGRCVKSRVLVKKVDKARAEDLVVMGTMLLECQICFSFVFAESEVVQEVFDFIFPGESLPSIVCK